jgi:hypothetical protein
MSSKRAINLYRSILHSHRKKLPADIRALGNAYVRNEFHLHKKVTSNDHLKLFFDGWEKYLIQLESRMGSFGKDLNESERVHLSSEQQDKLRQIKKEAEDKEK